MRSIADAITADLASRRPRVQIEHPRAAGWKITYRLPVDDFEFNDTRQAFIDSVKTDKPIMFEAAVLARLAEEIAYQGEALNDSTGKPATFSSQDTLDALGVSSASDAVRRVYGTDYIVKAVYERLMNEAGAHSMGEVIVGDDDAPDPTRAG